MIFVKVFDPECRFAVEFALKVDYARDLFERSDSVPYSRPTSNEFSSSF